MRTAALGLSVMMVASCWGGERDLDEDFDNCGGFGNACSRAHVDTPSCSAGVCDGDCAPGYADCDSDKLTNGCETHVDVDPDNCGACGEVCSPDRVASRTCAAGACTGECVAGAADCDGDTRSNGCELVRGAPADEGAIGSPCPCGNTAFCQCTTAGVANGLTCLYEAYFTGFPIPGGCSKNCTADADCGPGSYCFNYGMVTLGYLPNLRRCAHACIDDADCAMGTHCISDTRTGTLKRCEATLYPSVGINGVCP